MRSRRQAGADLLTGLLLAAAGIAILVISVGMPRFEERGVNPWTVPGIMPAAIGAVLALLAVVLVLRAARQWRAAAGEPPGEAAERPPAARPTGAAAVALAAALAGGYVALLGRLPFAWLTFGFLIVFMAAFEFRQWRADASTWRRPASIAGIAALVALVVPWVFETLFLVRLP